MRAAAAGACERARLLLHADKRKKLIRERERTTNLKHREVMLAQAYAVLLDRMPYNECTRAALVRPRIISSSRDERASSIYPRQLAGM